MHLVGPCLRAAGAVATRAASGFFDDGCPQRAAAISYYALFALFPLAIMTVSVFGLVVDDERARARVIDAILDRLPLREDRGRADLHEVLNTVTGQATGFGVVGAVTMLFAASGVMAAVRHGLNAVWDVRDARPPLQGKLVDLLLVLVFGVATALSFAATLVVRVASALSDTLADLGPLGDGVARAIVVAGQVAPLLIMLAVFAALLRLAPARATTLRDVWPGAVVAAIGVELAKNAFAFYLGTAADYGAIYASLATVVAFLVFVFICANVFLFGAEVAAAWPHVRDAPDGDDTTDGPPIAERVRRALRGLVVRRDEHDATRGDDGRR